MISKSYQKLSDDIMVIIEKNKKSFHCELCGCNVFKNPYDENLKNYNKNIFICNGCNTNYIGE